MRVRFSYEHTYHHSDIQVKALLVMISSGLSLNLISHAHASTLLFIIGAWRKALETSFGIVEKSSIEKTL